MAAAGRSGWKIEFVVPAGAAQALTDALEPHTGIVSMFMDDDEVSARVSGFGDDAPDEAVLRRDLAAAAQAAGIAPPPVDLVWLPDLDWVALNRESFPPQHIGRFWIRDSYHDEPPPAGAVSITIDAATAFGTGRHGTTRGCLLALGDLARRRLQPGPVLDMGCGTAILAIAAAKLLRRRVVASDIDPEAVRMARLNAVRNGAGSGVATTVSRGYDAAIIERDGPYVLILANILANPLTRMAPACARHLAPGGYVVLSGLLTAQEAAVLAAHRIQGLVLVRRYRIEGWSTLVLRRGYTR